MGPLAIIEGAELVSKFISKKKKKPDFKIFMINQDHENNQTRIEISVENFNLFASKYNKDKGYVYFNANENELQLHIESRLNFEENVKEMIEDIEQSAREIIEQNA